MTVYYVDKTTGDNSDTGLTEVTMMADGEETEAFEIKQDIVLP